MVKSTNYFNTNKYRAVLSRLPDVELFCQKVNLPGISLTPINTNGHLSGITDLISDSQISYDDLSVTFIVDENLENYISVLKWLKTISPDDDLYNIYPESIPELEELYSTDIEVFIKNNNQQTIGSFTYKRCMPTNLSGLELSVSEDLIVTASLTFKVPELDFDFRYSKIKTNSHGYQIPSECEENNKICIECENFR